MKNLYKFRLAVIVLFNFYFTDSLKSQHSSIHQLQMNDVHQSALNLKSHQELSQSCKKGGVIKLIGPLLEPCNDTTLTPTEGDSIQFLMADTTAVTEGAAGAGISWDFSNLTPVDTQEVQIWVNAQSSPYFATFPNANKCQNIPAFNAYYYYSYDSDSVTYWGGVENAGDEIYTNPLVTLECPLGYLDEFRDTAYANSSGSGGVTSHRHRYRHVTYDAYGILMLPGSTLYDALRMKMEETILDTMFIGGNYFGYTISNVTVYQWFATDANNPTWHLNITYGEVYYSITNDTSYFKAVSYLRPGLGGNVCSATADFTYSDSSYTVTFTDNSSGQVSSYSWTFGDGDSSTLANPVHAYDTSGTYQACLTVSDTAVCQTSMCKTITLISTTPPGGSADNDNDGMNDGWETSNGFDPNDPKDAFGDVDGDYVLNLFEYQLGSDPNNSSNPTATNISSGQNLETEIGSAAQGTVLRVESGTYNVTYMTFSSKRIMIQGGWNSTFTSRDPQNSPTTLDGQSTDEVLYFSTTNSDSGTIILDGLNFVNGGGNFGAVNIIGQYGIWKVSINECIIKNSQSTSNSGMVLNINHWYGCSGDVTISKTIVASNSSASGIHNQTTQGSTGKWRVINCSISNNRSSSFSEGYGIKSFTLDSSTCSILIKNTIIRGNGLEDLNISSSLNVDASYSNIDSVKTTLGAVYNPTAGMLDANPLFIDTAAFNYNLALGSPCVDAGLITGFPYVGIAPDMGALESSFVTSLPDQNKVNSLLSVYPNPLAEGKKLNVALEITEKAEIQFYDLPGRLLDSRLLAGGKNEFELFLSPGIYFYKLLSQKTILEVGKLIVH